MRINSQAELGNKLITSAVDAYMAFLKDSYSKAIDEVIPDQFIVQTYGKNSLKYFSAKAGDGAIYRKPDLFWLDI